MTPRIRPVFARPRVDRYGLKPEELLYAEICAAADIVFKGMQRAVPECGLEALILFDDAWGSTLALPVSKFNLEAVRQQVAASNASWEKATAKHV
jgi:hypothetical protein